MFIAALPDADRSHITDLIDSPVVTVDADTSVEDACEVRSVPDTRCEAISSVPHRSCFPRTSHASP